MRIRCHEKRALWRRLLLLPLTLLLLCWLWFAYTNASSALLKPPAAAEQTYILPSGGPDITVLMPDGACQQLPLEEFLVGVVAAEMPAGFAPEALKSQAIAARTYVLSHSAAYGSPRHDNADICCDSAHCQAYVTQASLKTRWGEDFTQNYQAVCRAVAQTAGLAVFYKGNLAETPYCSTCGGLTQAARDVWGMDVPYLQSVQCLWDAHSPRAAAAVALPLAEAAQKLSVKPAALPAMSASYTVGGAVAELTVGGKKLGGLELRGLLGLDSAACHWLIEGGRIVFSTRGFGHGVGLCQYGADGMGKQGYTAEEIIGHYYQNTQVCLLYY